MSSSLTAPVVDPKLPPELEMQKNEALSGIRTYIASAAGFITTLASAGGFRVAEWLPVEIAAWGDVIQYFILGVCYVLAAYYRAKSTKVGFLAKKKAQELKVEQAIEKLLGKEDKANK